MSAAVLRGARGTKQTSSSELASWLVAASSASLVLPMPPGPTIVTSRVSGLVMSSSNAANSSSRPMKCVRDAGRFERRDLRLLSGGKVLGSCREVSWKTCSGRGKSLTRCLPRSRSSASGGNVSRMMPCVTSDSRIWPPCPAASSRAARLTVGP